MSTTTTVRKGQHYCGANGDMTVWRVLAVAPDPSGIPHARLCQVAQPYEFKTLTCSLISDPRHFRLVSEEDDTGTALDCISDKLPRRRTPDLSPAA